MTKKELAKLRKQVAEYHSLMVAKGRKLTSYTCLHCNKTVETVQPTKSQVSGKGYWDTAKACVNCGEVNWVKTWPTGRTEVVNTAVTND